MYDNIFSEINDYLASNDAVATKVGHFPFRKRSEHIKRVFVWAERLLDDPQLPKIEKESVLIAALFHDAGYALSLSGADHAVNSAVVFREYAAKHAYEPKKTDFISYLIENHSRKDLMFLEDTPLELIILMEADLLDETGALSIVWDCMMEGAQELQSYEKTYAHIAEYSGNMLDQNPMFTEKAKKIWESKQTLLREFIAQLAYDLGKP